MKNTVRGNYSVNSQVNTVFKNIIKKNILYLNNTIPLLNYTFEIG